MGKTAPQNVRLQAGRTYTAKVAASDPDHDPLTYRWEVMEESLKPRSAATPSRGRRKVPGLIAAPTRSDISLQAPDQARSLPALCLRLLTATGMPRTPISLLRGEVGRKTAGQASRQRRPIARPAQPSMI